MAFGIPSIMTTLAPYHIISYGTLLGTSLFQTFINTKICYLELPKSAFTTLQKRLFPIYFRCQALLLVLTVLTFPPHGPTSLFKVKSNWIPLMVAGATSLANLLVYGPRSRQAMIDRTHQETRDARRPGDVDELSPDMLAVRRRFSRNHAMSIHLNLVAVIAMLWYGFSLASRIHIEVDS
ncbi:hypothetical protein BDP67DRAFT_443456 [Colletotrichum lupini]|nr:hypothetical protein BDP67DRAFT_443456 [Colletotrichum lupini]